MKHFIYIALFFMSAIGFAQQKHDISGRLLDLELDNAPLLHAKVVIKETGKAVVSNEDGFFKFENIDAGQYTLVYSFPGYETKEMLVTVSKTETTPLTLYLGASTLSLNDLSLVFASVSKN